MIGIRVRVGDLLEVVNDAFLRWPVVIGLYHECEICTQLMRFSVWRIVVSVE